MSHGQRSRCPGTGASAGVPEPRVPEPRVPEPHAIAQEPQLPRAAGIRGHRRGSGGGHRLLLPEAGRPRPEVLLHHPPRRTGLPWAAGLVAGAGGGGGRRARRAHPALLAGDRRPPSGRGLQDRRDGHRPRPARDRPRRPRHLDLRRRPRTGGAPDRDRRRRRRADRAPGQEGRPGPGGAGHRRRRELRRPLHTAGQSPGGGVPAAGGGRHRRRHGQRGAGAGAAGGRDRRADLRRPGHADRLRHVLPRDPAHPDRHHSDRRRVPVGGRDRPGRGGRRHCHPPGGPAVAADRRASPGADPGPRPCRRRPRRHLRRGHRQGHSRGPVLRSERAARAHPARRHLVGWRPAAGRCVQEPGLRLLAERLPRRPDLPRHVHRRGRWHRPVPPARPAADRRRRHRHRRDARRHAGRDAADGGAAHDRVPGLRRARPGLGGDRRRGGRLGRLGPPLRVAATAIASPRRRRGGSAPRAGALPGAAPAAPGEQSVRAAKEAGPGR